MDVRCVLVMAHILIERLLVSARNWGYKCISRVPTISNSSQRYMRFNSEMFSEFGGASGNSKYREYSVFSLISILFFSGGPPAIAWRIVSIVINSIYRHAFSWIPHIFKEIRKLHPFCAYPYSSTPIILPRPVKWIGASTNHLTPYFINWSLFACLGLSMFGVSQCQLLPVEASTGYCISRLQRFTPYDCVISTIAATKVPDNSSSTLGFRWSCFRFHFKSSKDPSTEAYFSRHSIVNGSVMLSGGMRWYHVPPRNNYPETA